MKLALRMIPTEVWVDVFCYSWITRKKLAKIVHMFRNRYFAEILQYCLHERGKQSLGIVHLDKETLPNIPRTQMPENIKFFEQLAICHFDFQTIDFLRRISTLFNANQVNLFFSRWSQESLANYRTVFDHLAPMLHGIHSLNFNQNAIPLVEEYFAHKLAQVKMITLKANDFDPTTHQAVVDFCLNWLTSTGERDPAEPRFLQVDEADTKVIQLFSTAIQQQFLSAKSPCTFAIALFQRKRTRYGQNTLNNLQLENGIGEQLHRQKSSQYAAYLIVRHQPNAGAALREWAKSTVEKSDKSSVIRIGRDFTRPEFTQFRFGYIDELTIGQIDANGGDNEVFGVRILCAIIGVIIMIKFVSSVRHSAH